MDELIIREREFKEKLVQTINESSLPAFIIKPTLKEILDQVSILEQQQYEKACKNEKERKENIKTNKQEVQNEQN